MCGGAGDPGEVPGLRSPFPETTPSTARGGQGGSGRRVARAAGLLL